MLIFVFYPTGVHPGVSLLPLQYKVLRLLWIVRQRRQVQINIHILCMWCFIANKNVISNKEKSLVLQDGH